MLPPIKQNSLKGGSSSSAYFSASLPHVDSSSYAATPSPHGSRPACSSPLATHVQYSSHEVNSTNLTGNLQQQQQKKSLTSSIINNNTEHLRSPRLVQSALEHQDIDSTPISSIGYTIAQYGDTNKKSNKNNLSTLLKNYNITEKEQQTTTISKNLDTESINLKNQSFLPESQTTHEFTKVDKLAFLPTSTDKTVFFCLINFF